MQVSLSQNIGISPSKFCRADAVEGGVNSGHGKYETSRHLHAFKRPNSTHRLHVLVFISSWKKFGYTNNCPRSSIESSQQYGKNVCTEQPSLKKISPLCSI